MDEKPKILWKNVDNKYQYHVTISTIGSTIESENVDESIVYIEDLEKRRQAYGICGECNEPDFLNEIKSHLQIYINDIVQCYGITQDLNNKDSDNNYTVQSTSANPISECLDVQLSELELNEICQDSEHNIE
ncbi:kinase-like domain-containing protein [Rhizophagus irregularis DAOM 181602=DAOM 197198]|nr:kinase-like domain-containing protein [Rhizophagus irregularis DAOM 181602=DAOM 197198]